MSQEKSLCSVIILITLMLASLAVADANNLIVNGDFELMTLNGYHFLNFVNSCEYDNDNGPSAPGSNCAVTYSSGSDIRTFRHCGIKAGKTYVASWDYKTSPEITDPNLVVATAHLRFYANAVDVNGVYVIDPNTGSAIGVVDVNLTSTNGNWVAATPVSVVAPAGAKSLDIAFDHIAGYALMYPVISFDNVVVYEQNAVPEPPSYLDVNDSIIANPGFEDVSLDPNVWYSWFHSADGNCVSLIEGNTPPYGPPYDGNKCARLTRNFGEMRDIIDIRTPCYPVDANDNYAVTISYKTLPGFTGSARAFLRYWKYNDGSTGHIGDFVWALPPTNGEWVTIKSCCIRPPPFARSIDIRIGMWRDFGTTYGWGEGVGTLLIDNVTAIKTSTKGDLNCDCDINFYDLAMLAQRWLTVFEN